ncbi:MAG TPA: hypothetical protein DCY91_30350 [Cyanobacteria bacterium UBA11370]|nr:hypothetical protein [Cyanobacteria bacterium UBA11370]
MFVVCFLLFVTKKNKLTTNNQQRPTNNQQPTANNKKGVCKIDDSSTTCQFICFCTSIFCWV